MKLGETVGKIAEYGNRNSPIILAGLGIAGLWTTAYMAYKSGTKAHKILQDYHEDIKRVKPNDKEAKNAVLKETAKELIPIILPPLIMGALSTGCIIGSNKISAKRLAIMSTAYTLADTKLKTYQEKVIETLGNQKAQKVREAIAEDTVKNNPVGESTQIIMTGDGDVLALDSHSGRYFRSNAEKIGQAINALSAEAISDMYISLNDFYDKVGLPKIPMGDDFGWNIDDLMQVGGGAKLPIYYTASLTPENKPCLVVEYDVSPRMDYKNLY